MHSELEAMVEIFDSRLKEPLKKVDQMIFCLEMKEKGRTNIFSTFDTHRRQLLLSASMLYSV